MEHLRELATDDASKQLVLSLTGELDGALASYAGDRPALDRVFAAYERGDHEAVHAEVVDAVGPMEHNASRRMKELADRVERAMTALSVAAARRE
jgi:hypothetical protein